jgi:hypothetical protein
VLGVPGDREFAQFCDYCKYGISKKKGKALVRPAAYKQQGQPCLQDRWEQSERNIYVLHLCDRLNQEHGHDNLGAFPLSLGFATYLVIEQGTPGRHSGLPPSARTVVEPNAIAARTTNMRMRVFFTVFSFSRKTRFSSAVQSVLNFWVLVEVESRVSRFDISRGIFLYFCLSKRRFLCASHG